MTQDILDRLVGGVSSRQGVAQDIATIKRELTSLKGEVQEISKRQDSQERELTTVEAEVEQLQQQNLSAMDDGASSASGDRGGTGSRPGLGYNALPVGYIRDSPHGHSVLPTSRPG